MLTKRANILFDEQIWQKLTTLAKKQSTSIGELVRNAVEEKYVQNNDLEKRRNVIDHILKIRKRVKGKIDYKALINEGRKF